ncbi:MAG: GMC oxidoreductase [Gammaproteobacteria bacterium]
MHPLGSARCGKDRRDSVVNLQGEVHDHPGLFVVDASALPAAPGSPPSMTIAAWSAHVCDGLQAAPVNSRRHTVTQQTVQETSL